MTKPKAVHERQNTVLGDGDPTAENANQIPHGAMIRMNEPTAPAFLLHSQTTEAPCETRRSAQPARSDDGNNTPTGTFIIMEMEESISSMDGHNLGAGPPLGAIVSKADDVQFHRYNHIHDDLDEVVEEVLTERTRLEAKQRESDNTTDILRAVEAALATEKALKVAYRDPAPPTTNVPISQRQQATGDHHQRQTPNLHQSQNDDQQQLHQPGAYTGTPGSSLHRLDKLRFSLLRPTEPATMEEGAIQGHQQQSTVNTMTPPTCRIVNSGLVEASVVPREAAMGILQQAQEVDVSGVLGLNFIRKKMELLDHRLGFCFIMGCLVVLAIILGVVFSNKMPHTSTTPPSLSTSISPSSSPSVALTGPMDLLYDDLPDYTQESLGNFSTPQWVAFDWLINHQNITMLPEWEKKQLFYAFEGEKWPDVIKGHWMDEDMEECLWFSSKFGAFIFGLYDPSKADPTLPDPCNVHNELQSLVLADLQLEGLTPSIPQEIMLLTSLSVLSLEFNRIAMPLSNLLPSELDHMSNLTFLSLRVNSLTGSLPSELGLITRLTDLRLAENSLSGPLPSELARMKNLTVLWMGYNFLTGLLPTELSLLTNLTTLGLAWNSLSGSLPSELGRMSNLNYLVADYNSLTGMLPSELGLMTDMTNMDFSGNSLSGSFPSELVRMTNMKFLYLGNNLLTGLIPSELGNMRNLTHLWLGATPRTAIYPSELAVFDKEAMNSTGNSFSGPLPSELRRLSNLTIFFISGNSFSGPIFTEIGEMTSLQELDMDHNLFRGPIPSELGNLANLKWLDLSYLPLLTGSIPSELSLLTMLGHLDLRGSSGLSGTIPEELCYLQQNSSCTFSDFVGQTYNCTLAFDCTMSLCGCDCPCSSHNGTVSKSISSKETDPVGIPFSR